MKKTILRGTIIILIGLVLGGAYFAYTSLSPSREAQASSNDVETVTIEKGNLVSTISAIGKVRSSQTATLTWDTSGTVEAVNVAVGEIVQAGDVLATLEQTSLLQNVIMAHADLASAETALEDLYTNAELATTNAMKEIAAYAQQVKDAQYQLDNYTIPSNQADLETMEALELMEAKLNQARQDFEPYKYLSSGNDTRQDLKEDLDEAQSDYNAAVKRLDYEYELQVAQDGLKKAQKDYEKWVDGPFAKDIAAAEARIAAAEATLSQAWVEAPFAGTITVADPQPGDQVSPNSPAFRLDDLSTLQVDMEVSEIDINQVAVGQEVVLTFDAIRNQDYYGVVTEIALIGSEATGVVNYTVTVELTDADDDVRSGMTSEVEIVVEQRDQALLVPNQAIRVDENGNQVVYINPDESMQPIIVKLGASSEAYSEVLEGDLQSGDQIVLNPVTESEEDEKSGGMFGGGMGSQMGDGDGPQPGSFSGGGQ